MFILPDQCPPRMCDDWHQRCRNDKVCTRFYYDVQFYCHNILEWQDDQVEPTCTPICQMAIDKLALVTNRTMGYNIICCACGNYSDQRSNNLVAIRSWEKRRREIRNVKHFCQHNCTKCDEMRPLSERQHMSTHSVSPIAGAYHGQPGLLAFIATMRTFASIPLPYENIRAESINLVFHGLALI